MNFTPRAKRIISILLTEKQPVSIQNLADKMDVSKRTVQRELESINSGLNRYQIQFVSKTGTGVWLKGFDEDKQRLLNDILLGDDYDAGNRDDRRKRLILETLKDKGLKKLFYYSSIFKVSEATISKDLEAVEEWLGKYQLHVIRRPGYGVEIEGSEEDYRRAIRGFIEENIDTSVLRDAYEKEELCVRSCEKLWNSNIGQILNKDILRRVINCILKLDDERVMTLTENSYIGLVIHITIAINRIMKNEMLKTDSKWSVNINHDADYALAERIVEELEEEFEIEIPELEISYICLHIKGAKHEKIPWAGQYDEKIENIELQQLINQMIDGYDPEVSGFLKRDEEFIQGLLAHLQPTFIRILYDMQIVNPVLEDIRKEYPNIFRRCQKVAEVIGQWLGKEVPEAEVGFLTVHFGAAMVRLEGKREAIRQVRLGIVCSSGIGISRLMSSKLEKVFKDRILINTFGKYDVTPYVVGKTDFFVSSIPLENVDAEILYVNPLLSETDMEQIQRMIVRYERVPGKQTEKDSAADQMEQINRMVSQINCVVKHMELIQVEPDITFENLLNEIGARLSPYHDLGEIIKEDIRKRERISSQIFTEFGFALFHTRTKGVIRPCFDICMPKNLGHFRDPQFKNIRTVFLMLLPIDENIGINSEIMGHISTMLIEDMNFINTVLNGDEGAIRNALSIQLKLFFNRYLAEYS